LAEAHPFLALLLFAVAGTAIIGVIRIFGVVIGTGGQVIRRADNPEAFDLGLIFTGWFFGAVLLIVAFVTWTGLESHKATESYLKELHDGQRTASSR
jgi:hypothetical protein